MEKGVIFFIITQIIIIICIVIARIQTSNFQKAYSLEPWEKVKRLTFLLKSLDTCNPWHTFYLCPEYYGKYGRPLKYDIPELYAKRKTILPLSQDKSWWHSKKDRRRAIVETIQELS